MKTLALLVPVFVLSACGGGGGSSPVVTPSDTNVTVPSAASLTLLIAPVKSFEFSWTDTAGATYYRVLENADGASGFTQVGGDISQGTESYTLSVPLYDRVNAQYILESCNTAGCSESSTVSVAGNLSDGIGYFKASNTNANDRFSENAISFSDDGSTLAIGARGERSINGDQSDNSTSNVGAVYVYTRSGATWVQSAYLKASNPGLGDEFGYALSLSDDGNTLAVGARNESSNATGVNGQINDAAPDSGAVYVFTYSGNVWGQSAYIKASNTGISDQFGGSVSLSGDANTLAVGAINEDTTASNSGAVYVFLQNNGVWSQEALLKSSNAESSDRFGTYVSLSDDGSVLAASAEYEDSNGSGESNNDETDSGAVYMFTNTTGTWAQSAYVKASNPGVANISPGDNFGRTLSLSGDGSTLAVGAWAERSNGTGVNSDTQNNNQQHQAGAVYVFDANGSAWSQVAYIKASISSHALWFGRSVALSDDGNTLVAGAPGHLGSALGIDGDETVTTGGARFGAAYVFEKTDSAWVQAHILKATNAEAEDWFGWSVAVSGDGNNIAVGAFAEKSNAVGINGDDSDNSETNSGAVYLY